MDGGVVGGAFLSAFLQVVFERLASHEVVDFLSGNKDIDELLSMLKIKLLSANTVLDDAEAKQLTKPAVKMWLEELKDVIYHAEDILDEIAIEAWQRKRKDISQPGTSQVRRIFAASVSKFDRNMTTKMRQIIQRVEFVVKEKDFLGLKDSPGDCKLLPRVPTTSLVDESGIYGRDGDKEALMNMLVSNDASDKISVVSIVGMGGIGKTTLAQLLYNDSTVDTLFDFKAWVCVSEEFDVYRITKEILEAVGMGLGSINSTNLNQLQVHLKARVMGKKFLLVLDDFWNENYVNWETLRAPLNYGACGSKIIVTSRSERVASIVATTPIYFLKKLTNDDCWLLLAKYAYAFGDFLQPCQEATGKKIAKICQGLPLAAKALGTLLCSKYAPSEWNDLLQNGVWELFENGSSIIPSLQLSYHYLPSHLKRCFAYCSILPKNFEFKKKQVVQLWMAENLLQQTSGIKQLEVIGDEYFNDLVSMSFFQQSSSGQQNFVMHDLIHDLAKSISGNFVTVLGEESRPYISKKTRHASFYASLPQGYAQIETLKEAKYLRTMLQLDVTYGFQSWFIFNRISRCLEWTRLTHLRVLSLHCVTEVPYSIGYMCHLRYLDISANVVKELPDSIGWLINLLVLKLFYCRNLVQLPTNFHGLINLRHLNISKTKLKEMPIKMGKLRHLQTLTSFPIGKASGSSIKELGGLQQLQGALSILQLQNVMSQEACGANLKQKKGLEELVLQWSSSTNNSEEDRVVLNELQPNENLKELTIDGYGGTRFPNWLGYHSYSNLVSLHLLKCPYCFSLPPLGQLPSLKILSICEFNQIEIVGHGFYGHNEPFRCLQVLEFRGLQVWKKWCSYINDSFVAFPCLQELIITDCHRLSGDLPSHLPLLTKLKISNCPKLVTSIHKVPAICELLMKSCDMSWNSFGASGGSRHEFTYLTIIRIYNCPNIASLPEGGLSVPNLRELSFNNCHNLKYFPEWMHKSLLSLEYLLISNCPKFESFPKEGLPSSLKRLAIMGCEKLVANQSEWHLQDHSSLVWFEISNQTETTELLVGEGVLPDTLTTLEINGCLNLMQLGNDGIYSLALQELRIQDCPKLQRLPDEYLSISLSFLQIRNCPLLTQRYEMYIGEGWHRIAHIPCVWMDDKIITVSSDNTHEVEEAWSQQEWCDKKIQESHDNYLVSQRTLQHTLRQYMDWRKMMTDELPQE